MLRAALNRGSAPPARPARARTARTGPPAAVDLAAVDLAAVDLAALRAAVAADHAIADQAHDVSHLDRVAGLAGWIARRLGVDPKLAKIAAYVHDYHRVAEARTGVRPLPADAANDLVRAVLDRHGVPPRCHLDVLCAVDATGRYRMAGDTLPDDLADVCPVAAIVHDADNLDAMGVVGLARAVGYGALLGEPLWEPDAAIRATYSEGLSSSVLAHCYEKLVHLADEMLTEPARELARLRLADLFGVLGRLRTELTAAPAERAMAWDPRTGYLRLTLDAMAGMDELDVDCRLTFTAEARIGLRGRRRGHRRWVCYLELSELPPVARAAMAAAERVVCCGGGLRIRLRRGPPDEIAAGRAVVEIELAGGRPTAVTLHLAALSPPQDGVSMIAG
jgi:uncharacterized protein